MNRMAVPWSSRISRSSFSTWAWTVTSSAVVGSSAISSSGSSARPIAIIARCCMPPENWCGYSRARSAGARRWTLASRSTALAFAASQALWRWRT